MLAGSTDAALVLQMGHKALGATYPTDSSALPPDASLGVSTNHIVELINGRFTVFRRPTLGRLETMTDLAFWQNAGITFPSGVLPTDPRVVFDTASARWFASMVDTPPTSNRFMLAVSASADPTGTWHATAFPADPINGDFADFPTFGLDANGVYLCGDLFQSDNSPIGSTLVAIPKNDLLGTSLSIEGMTSFGALDYFTFGSILQPAVTLGPASTSETVLSMGDLGYDFQPHSTLVEFPVQNVTSPGAAVLGAVSTIDVPPYSIPINPWQLGASTNNIDDGDARMSAMVYRVGDLLYATHSTQVNNRAAIQWFIINAVNFSVVDTGIISDPVLDLFFPSIAANASGTVVLAFNGSSRTNFISSYALLGEPINGRLSFGNFILLKAGAAGYRVNATADNPNRWGDYSATTVDPVDPTHFWTLTMYPSSSTAWSTQITELIAAPLLLSVTQASTSIVLSWPAAAAGYQLQSTPGLSHPNWSLVSQTPILNNNQFTVSLPLTGSMQLFRLVK